MVPPECGHHNRPVDDYSGNFQPLRARLMAETDGDYLRFLGSLTPRYWRVWLDIALGYLFLAATVYLAGLGSSGIAHVAGTVLGALAVGYGVAYLQLFLHEAAHYHLTPDRVLNDRLCDALISWQVGTTVSRYRPIHFAHHRHLGTRADTENSYFRALDLRLIVETLTGVHALRILSNRRRQLDQRPESAPSTQRDAGAMLRGIASHAVVCAMAYAVSGWPGAAAWILGVGAFYPVFATLRQLLEHRSGDADAAADYTKADHGALTRMFGNGPLASTFGGAGFSRHLLHHWEPQVSYTRLGDLENYFPGTCVAPIIAARRSSYVQTLAALWRGPLKRPATGQ